MKKIFVTSLFLGLASVSQAAFITCAPPQDTVIDNAVSGSRDFTCNPGGNNIASDGQLITNIRIRVSGTFQENDAPTGSNYSVLFTSTNTGSSFVIGNVGCTATGNENGDNQALGNCTGLSSVVAVSGLPDVLAGFIVTVTGQAGSTPLPFNASASVAYEVTTTSEPPPPGPEVPEPATYALMAAGLGALAAFGRKA